MFDSTWTFLYVYGKRSTPVTMEAAIGGMGDTCIIIVEINKKVEKLEKDKARNMFYFIVLT